MDSNPLPSPVVNSAGSRCARTSVGWALAALALAGATLARAQLSPNGGEFQVNTYTTSSQESPTVAARRPAGRLVRCLREVRIRRVNGHDRLERSTPSAWTCHGTALGAVAPGQHLSRRG